MTPGTHIGLSEADIRAGDKKAKTPKCSKCGDTITGKEYPGGLDFKCWNEVVNPNG